MYTQNIYKIIKAYKTTVTCYDLVLTSSTWFSRQPTAVQVTARSAPTAVTSHPEVTQSNHLVSRPTWIS